MLRSIPSKLGGVVVLLLSIVILLIFPFFFNYKSAIMKYELNVREKENREICLKDEFFLTEQFYENKIFININFLYSFKNNIYRFIIKYKNFILNSNLFYNKIVPFVN
jgi:hypothetical protein